MKNRFDFIRAGGAVLVAVAALFICSCAQKETGAEEPADKAVEVSIAEAAGRAHNMALDILFDKLKAAEAASTRSDGDEAPIDPEPEPETLSQLLVQSIVEGMRGLVDYASVWKELQSYMDYCTQNPEAEPVLIEWSDEARNILVKLAVIAKSNYGNAETAAAEISAVSNLAYCSLPKAEFDDIAVVAHIMKYSFEYWYDNYNEWFPEQAAFKWSNVSRADCEWTIGVMRGDAQFRNGGWMTNVMGALSYNAKIAFACACATAGSMTAALADYQDENGAYIIDESLVEDLQYSFSYGIALSALGSLGAAEDWETEEVEPEEP